jgi:DNA-binding FadR family transcriptional regulator
MLVKSSPQINHDEYDGTGVQMPSAPDRQERATARTAGADPLRTAAGQGQPAAGTARQAASGRAAGAAERITGMIDNVAAGSRLGTKEELRTLCGVSVGTFNEALRILQTRGLVTVKPGPGGGLFSAEQSPMVRLGNSVLALDARANDVADAVRIRDALDPLLIEDALWHASPADIAGLRAHITVMEEAAESADHVAFVHANWRLHAAIAAISPNGLLGSLYTHLLDLIESHTLSVLPAAEEPLDRYIADRFRLHRALVDALDRRDREAALHLIHEHNTSLRSDAPA